MRRELCAFFFFFFFLLLPNAVCHHVKSGVCFLFIWVLLQYKTIGRQLFWTHFLCTLNSLSCCSRGSNHLPTFPPLTLFRTRIVIGLNRPSSHIHIYTNALKIFCSFWFFLILRPLSFLILTQNYFHTSQRSPWVRSSRSQYFSSSVRPYTRFCHPFRFVKRKK